MIRRLGIGLLIWATCGGIGAKAEEPLFGFVVSYDAPDNVTNVSAWIESPAGRRGFVRTENGDLVTDAGPIRFWATNLCFDACFPSHEQAAMLAARLARLGINSVRMHHMDSRSIWGSSPNKLTIDPAQLDRLDYLVYKLKQHGVYTNINLHVSRWLGEAEGFPSRDGRPKYDKGIGNFEPRMIELQKKYARDLLTHVNPYTKTSYANEPAVAFVEISNEDALYSIFNRGELDDLPEPYAATYRGLWNRWLVEKYGNTKKLRAAWKAGEWPLGREMLENGRFSSGIDKAWNLERNPETRVEWSVENTGPNKGPALRIVLTKSGRVSWHPQLTQSGFSVKKDTPYTLVFQARSPDAKSLGVNCMMSHQPWQRLGLSSNAQVGPAWKEYRFTFLAESDDPDARITFTNFQPGTYELTAVSLRPGGIVGLGKSQRLENLSVPVLRHGNQNLTEPARADFADFLWDTERDYWWGMYRFLKDELGVRSLVSGTQLTYSPTHIQAELDYIDAHSYWNHPVFPGRPWDSRNWYVRNRALVNTPGGTLAGLAVRQVAGMAFTVSEYNHPAPNYYAAEGFPMIAAFGAFHRWDGIFGFTYSHADKFQPRKVANYFDIQSNTTRLVHMPACAAMFLRGDVAGARETILAGLAPQLEREKLRQTLTPRSLTADRLGLDPRLSLLHAMAVDLDGKATSRVRETHHADSILQPSSGAFHAPYLDEDTKVFVSDTGQLRWDISQEGAGYFTADTPRVKLFTGFVGGRTFELGNVTIKIGSTRLDWATISMVAVDGDSFGSPGRILIAATGWSQNSGVVPEEIDSDRITLGNRWGDEPILCEGIPASIQLPVKADRVRFYPLDESGDRRPVVAVDEVDGSVSLPLSAQHKTVWYEVEIGR